MGHGQAGWRLQAAPRNQPRGFKKHQFLASLVYPTTQFTLPRLPPDEREDLWATLVTKAAKLELEEQDARGIRRAKVDTDSPSSGATSLSACTARESTSTEEGVRLSSGQDARDACTLSEGRGCVIVSHRGQQPRQGDLGECTLTSWIGGEINDVLRITLFFGSMALAWI